MTDLAFRNRQVTTTARAGRGDYDGALTVFQTLGALGDRRYGDRNAPHAWILPSVSAAARAARDPLDERHDCSLGVVAPGSEVLGYLSEGVISAGFRASGDVALYTMVASTVRLMQFSAVWLTARLRSNRRCRCFSRHARPGDANACRAAGAATPLVAFRPEALLSRRVCPASPARRSPTLHSHWRWP